jgi:predicted Zn-dependent peptidase
LAYSYSRRFLDNGLTLVEVCQPHLHRGSIAVYFKAGSMYETAAENGLSHFLEHMVFRGTAHHPNAYDVNLAVEKLGGNLFAATGPDSTEFGITLPTECLVSGSELLAEVVTAPVFHDMEIERRIVIEEIREDLDEEGKPIDMDFLSRRRLWPGHALGYAVTGPLDNALGFTVDDIQNHFLKHYVAENAVVCLSGSYDKDVLVPAVEKAFSHIPKRHSNLTVPPPPLGLGPSVWHAHRPGSQTQVRIAFHGPGGSSSDRIALAIMMGILDDGMSTRLHRRIFDELGLAYNVSADMELYKDAGAINFDATTSHGKVVEIIKQIAKLIVELRDHPVERQELEKAKRREVWDLEGFLDDPHAMSAWYGEQDLYWRPRTIEDRIRIVGSIAEDDIVRVARRIFTSKNMHVTTVGVLDDQTQKEVEREMLQFS